MANVFATRTGVWSATATWNTSALPATIDDVFSNNFTVYVDDSFQVRTVTNLSAVGITPGGRFIFNDGVSLSANVIGGGTNQVACVQFLSAFPASSTLVGNLCAVNTSIAGPRALFHNGSGTLTVYGNGLGRIKGIGNPADGYIGHYGTGVLNLFGNYIAGTQIAVDNRGIWNGSSGTINLVGTLSGGAGGEGLYNSSTGTVNVTGNVFGGPGGTGATATGLANLAGGQVNILGNVIGTNASGVTNSSSGIVNVIGSVVGGNAGNVRGIGNSGTGTVNISGNCTGGRAINTEAINNSSSGAVNIIGNIIGTGTFGAMNTSTGTFTIFGNVIGGTGGSAHGMQNTTTSTGTITVNGDVIGGTGSGAVGILNNIGSRVIINGNVIAGTGSLSYGISQNGTGYVEVNGFVVGNDFGLGSSGINSSPGIFGSQTGTTIIRGLSCGVRGQWPTGGNVFIIPQNTSTATLFTSASAAQVLFTSLSTNIVPPASSVRLGTKYNLNDYTGTCAMPSISSVLQGVSVDNSVGIAALQPQTIWNYSTLSATDVNSLGGRLANVATVQSIGQQLTALNL